MGISATPSLPPGFDGTIASGSNAPACAPKYVLEIRHSLHARVQRVLSRSSLDSKRFHVKGLIEVVTATF